MPGKEAAHSPRVAGRWPSSLNSMDYIQRSCQALYLSYMWEKDSIQGLQARHDRYYQMPFPKDHCLKGHRNLVLKPNTLEPHLPLERYEQKRIREMCCLIIHIKK